jgi:PAS domain-containing protein
MRRLSAPDTKSDEEDERWRLLIRHVPTAVAMFDREMRYLAASERWVRTYLPGIHNPIGRFHYDLLPECPERWRIDHRSWPRR